MSLQPGPDQSMNEAEKRYFRAPGRINIIGEHTDYNDGFVLPTNTALYTTVTAAPRRDRLIRVATRTLNDTGEFEVGAGLDSGAPAWLTYVHGVATKLEAAGARLSGADLDIDGNIPLGGGLSSSASLELAVACALAALAKAELSPTELAHICQQAEIDFAGVNCGIMDQYSVACGKAGTAMLLDCKSLQPEFADLPSEMSLVVTDSGVKHQHPGSGYNDRASECTSAVRAIRKSGTHVRSLRDLSLETLKSQRHQLDDLLYRRAKHVVTENARTIAAFTALNDGDIDRLGELVAESHASLRDDYEVSCEGIEELVELLSKYDGVTGSRMVGGGFGGCVLSVVRNAAVAAVVDNIRSDYGSVIGRTPWIHVVSPAHAAEEVSQ